MLSDEEIEERIAGRRWVFAYDPVTGERAGFTSCPERRVPATRMLYEMDGYRVEVMTVGEVDEVWGGSDAGARVAYRVCVWSTR